ncbi:MAG: hypothetical protein RIB45_09250 [Marivibrio sp.]|uniref:hypothetical protein n=1 Tax=Marivibrio sp. TaxID=2039719 RepID=UPI0032EF499B
MTDRVGVSDARKRVIVQETARAAHAELLLTYWLRETIGADDLERISGADLDRALRYIRTVAAMLQERADGRRAVGES